MQEIIESLEQRLREQDQELSVIRDEMQLKELEYESAIEKMKEEIDNYALQFQ